MSSGSCSGCSSDDVEQDTHENAVRYKLRKRSRETRSNMARMARFIEEDEDYWSDSDHHEIKRKRSHVRVTATKRERARMHKLNNAYDKLRKVVPKIDRDGSNQRLTKIATLRLAIDYIRALTTFLGTLNDKEKNQENDEETGSSTEEDDTDILTKLIDSVTEECGWFWGGDFMNDHGP